MKELDAWDPSCLELALQCARVEKIALHKHISAANLEKCFSDVGSRISPSLHTLTLRVALGRNVMSLSEWQHLGAVLPESICHVKLGDLVTSFPALTRLRSLDINTKMLRSFDGLNLMQQLVHLELNAFDCTPFFPMTHKGCPPDFDQLAECRSLQSLKIDVINRVANPGDEYADDAAIDMDEEIFLPAIRSLVSSGQLKRLELSSHPSFTRSSRMIHRKVSYEQLRAMGVIVDEGGRACNLRDIRFQSLKVDAKTLLQMLLSCSSLIALFVQDVSTMDREIAWSI